MSGGRRILTGLVLLAVSIILILALLWILQRQLIYLPTQAVAEPGSGVEAVSFETEDGLTLAAWFVPFRGETYRGTMLVFNGNAGNRAHRLPLGAALADEGFSVLLTDYRGYGGNPGSPSEEGLAMDARAALSYVESRLGVPPDRLAYFGESLGAGVAISLARHQPPAALVLRSPFASLADIASVHYRWIPASILLRDRFPNVEAVAGLAVPVMVVAGSEDRIVPIGQSRQIYEAAPDPKRMLVIEGARHNDLELFAGEEMIEGITEFLTETIGS